jgi:TonB-dependent starch-binding outer membrane protein SusC
MRLTLLQKLKCYVLALVFLPFIGSNAFAQVTVQGTVLDAATGDPMPGVNVVLSEIERGSNTTIDGNFEIRNVESGTYTLIATFVGFQQYQTELQVGNTDVNVEIMLEEDILGLEELVVVGYGTQSRIDVTGSISSITAESFENLPVHSIESAIQGRAPGVHVSGLSGKLGQGVTMRIRGSSSVTADNQPLYVIDGIPVTTTDLSGNDAPTNPLADLNFNDVESIEILKDASAAAIYGSRASNGVVLITTKRGRPGATEVNYSFQAGFSEPTNRREWLNTEEYLELFREAAENTTRITNDPFWVNYAEGQFQTFSAGQFDGSSWADGIMISTDWQDLAFQDAAFSEHELSFRGGTETTRFYASGSVSDQEGIVIGDTFERISGRLNLDHTVNDYLSLGINMNIGRTINDRLSTDNAFATPMQLVAQPPLTPPYDPRTCESGAGDSYLSSNTDNCQLSGNYTLYYNGLLHRDHADYRTTIYRNFGNAFANINLRDDLFARTELGIDILTQNEDEYYGSLTARGVGSNQGQGFGISRYVQVLNYTSNTFLTWAPSIDENQDVEITAGFSYQQSTEQTSSLAGRDFPSDSFRKLASAAEITSGGSTGTEYSFLSYFARANYKFQDKYLLNISGRVDGSSRFGDENRYGFFPAASVGWILTEEDFLRDNQLLTFLKLRASYGITGNAAISNFASRGLFQGTSYNQVPGISPSQAPNEDLRWEQTAQFDIGLDFRLFNDRVTGEADYYVKHTEDLLLNVNVPGTSGYTTVLRNVGELENKGFEFVINTFNVVGDFNWSTSFNFSTNTNVLTNLDGQIIEGNFSNRAVEGHAIGVFYEREYAGVNPDNGDALYYLNRDATDDELNDGIVFEQDGRMVTADYGRSERVVIGDPNPDFIGGINNSFAWRGFDLDFLFQFVYGNDIYMGNGSFTSSNGDWFDNQTRDQLNRWQNPGDITDVPEARLALGNGTGNSSRYISDGSYLRLKTLTFGYSLSPNVTERIGLRSARVFAQGTNLLTFTNYEGWDPEVNTDFTASNINQGIEYYTAPQARTITLGVRLGL